MIAPGIRAASTLLGTGRSGLADGTRGQFYEPGGLRVSAERVWVADTNNHAIRVADLTAREVLTLRLSGL